MNVYGWIFMLGSFGIITGLCVFCFYRTLTSNRKGRENSAFSDFSEK